MPVKAYILQEADFAALLAAIDRDPAYGQRGGSSDVLSEKEREAHARAHRFFNYQVRTWIEGVKK